MSLLSLIPYLVLLGLLVNGVDLLPIDARI